MYNFLSVHVCIGVCGSTCLAIGDLCHCTDTADEMRPPARHLPWVFDRPSVSLFGMPAMPAQIIIAKCTRAYTQCFFPLEHASRKNNNNASLSVNTSSGYGCLFWEVRFNRVFLKKSCKSNLMTI